jgi:hypothetical protein
VKNHPLTASVLCREGLVAFRRYQTEPNINPPPLPFCVPLGTSKENQVVIGANISPFDMEESMEWFAYHVINPLMENLAKRVPLGGQYEDFPATPKNVIGSAVESYYGVTMRCVIDTLPVPAACHKGIWRQYQRYYDVNHDELVWGDVGMVIRFDLLPINSNHIK